MLLKCIKAISCNIVFGQENKVCKLYKSLYDLKQVPNKWHKKFDYSLLNNEFLSIEMNTCVYKMCR